MCEANAYLIEDGREQLVMAAVDVIEPDSADTWHLVDIFGSQKTLKGRLREMRLVDHKLLFEAYVSMESF